tara:strand:- start:104 stop:217 length:114 start_codon:yes stop_codon:yes gene_type:complete
MLKVKALRKKLLINIGKKDAFSEKNPIIIATEIIKQI